MNRHAQEFQDRVEAQGGSVIGKYVDKKTPVECRCSEKHICYPRPGRIQEGRGLCKECTALKLTPAQIRSREKFYAAVLKLNGRVVGKYTLCTEPVECRCVNDHECWPQPNSVISGQGICRACVGKCPIVAESNFIQKIKELNGTVIGKYAGSLTPVECKCVKDHECWPIPNYVSSGGGICPICAGNSPIVAEANFRKAIAEQGGQVVGDYENTRTRVECICSRGHPCFPRPSGIRAGFNMCIICSGLDPAIAEAKFRDRVINQLKGQVIGNYENVKTKIKCVCSEGHDCFPTPNSVNSGGGLCIICAGQDPKTAMDNFFKIMTEIEAIVIGPYIDTNTPIQCICPGGHEWKPRPSSVTRGSTSCRKCAGKDFDTTEAKCIETIVAMGGIVLGEYKGSRVPIQCICPKGHECYPRWTSIQQGCSLCRRCKNKTEFKVNDWLVLQNFLDVTQQARFDWCKNPATNRRLPFDFVVTINDPKIGIKTVVIELDGVQHFRQVSNWQSADISRQRDVYKTFQALSQNFGFIRIQQEDVYYNRFDWTNSLFEAIAEVQPGQILYIGDQNVYSRHDQDLQLALRNGYASLEADDVYEDEGDQVETIYPIGN